MAVGPLIKKKKKKKKKALVGCDHNKHLQPFEFPGFHDFYEVSWSSPCLNSPPPPPAPNHLFGPVIKVSAFKAADVGSIPASAVDLFSWLVPCQAPGWPAVSILWLGEMENQSATSQCGNTYNCSSRSILIYTSMLLGCWATNKQPRLSAHPSKKN